MKKDTKLKLIHILFPNKCPSCRRVISPTDLFCEKCFEEREAPLGDRCKVCFAKKEFCNCASKPKFFFRATAPFVYKKSVKNALLYLKNKKAERLAEYFAEEMVKDFDRKFPEVKADAVIPVPLHKSKYKLRGFNQSELIAKKIAEIKGIPLISTALIQADKTDSQHNLKYKLRYDNVKGVYRASGIPIDCQTVILIDDIMTSGATLNECSKMLRLEGVFKIYCLTVAKSE